MMLIKAAGSIMNVLCKQLLPEVAMRDEQFARLFATKSMNECSNRMMSALLMLATNEREKCSSVCADYGADDLIQIARAFYEKDATPEQMCKMLVDMIDEKEKIKVEEAKKADSKGKGKGKKDTTPTPPTKPTKATLPPLAPTPKSAPPTAKKVQIIEDDDDFELD